jgi:methylthioxylose transferase
VAWRADAGAATGRGNPDEPAASPRPPEPPRAQEREAAVWAAIVASGISLAAVTVFAGVRLGTAAAPFAGAYRFRVGPASALAVAVALAVGLVVRAGALTRLRWRPLLTLSYTTSLAWSVSLALVDGTAGLSRSVAGPGGYLADVAAVHDDPTRFVRTFVAHVRGVAAPAYSPSTRAHPPGQVLLLWVLTRLGLTGPVTLGLTLTALGCLTVPLVAVAVRSLCHETAARRLTVALALAPWAVWTAVSADAVTASLAASAVTLGVIGSEPGRRPWWAAGSGLALGSAALCAYGVAWLGIAVVATYFVRRRPLLNVVTGACALLPLWLFHSWGFSWTDGLSAAGADVAGRYGGHRAWLAWAPLDLVVLTVAAGPVVVRAARRVRLTPGWPFLAGAVPAVALGILTGLSRGEVERSWLPFFPWLLVPALAPSPRPPAPGDRQAAGPMPALLIALGAATAILLEAVILSPW